MFFFPLTPKGRQSRRVAKILYAQIVARAREAVFYREFAVPDSFTGRFEMIALHAGMIINRLNGEEGDGKRLAQSIFDEMFINMDISCRQSGIGDLGVPRHIQRMMTALKGRAMFYQEAAVSGVEALAEALNRNLYATVDRPDAAISQAMSRYIMACDARLKQQTIGEFMAGKVAFANLPQPDGGQDAENTKVA